MINDRQQAIRRLHSLPLYLQELSTLVGRTVRENELLPLAQMEPVREGLRAVPKNLRRAVSIPFDFRNGEAFSCLIRQLTQIAPKSIYLWPPRANDCGLFTVDKLDNIIFSFPFDINREGILLIATTDGNDSMLLDWSEGEGGERVLEIELRGPRWSRADLPIVADVSLPTTPG